MPPTASPSTGLLTRRSIEQYTIDADTEEYARSGTFGVKDTVTSHAVAGFAVPVRAVFDATANRLALRTLLGASA